MAEMVLLRLGPGKLAGPLALEVPGLQLVPTRTASRTSRGAPPAGYPKSLVACLEKGVLSHVIGADGENGHDLEVAYVGPEVDSDPACHSSSRKAPSLPSATSIAMC